MNILTAFDIFLLPKRVAEISKILGWKDYKRLCKAHVLEIFKVLGYPDGYAACPATDAKRG